MPVTAGANDVQLTIVDEAGREKTQQLDFFFDNRLLSKGTHDFGYGVGAPLTITGTQHDYDTEKLIFSGFHRLGLTDSLTAGINLQARDIQQVLGAEATIAMTPGSASAESAAWNLFQSRIYEDWLHQTLDSMTSNSVSHAQRSLFVTAAWLVSACQFLPMITRAQGTASTAANLAAVATPSSLYTSGDTTVGALNDGFVPRSSRDNRRGSYGNWPQVGGQWVQYDWTQPINTKQIEVIGGMTVKVCGCQKPAA